MKHRRRWGVVFALYGTVLVGYLLTGARSESIGVDVPLTSLDGWLPASVPLTIVYICYFPYLFWVFLSVSREKCFYRHLPVTLGIAAVSLGIFLVFPTRAPEVMIDSKGAAGALIGLIRDVDPAGNSFPSLHVSLTVFASYLAARHGVLPAWLATFITLAIIVSTLATGQHVIVDLLGGGLIAFAAYRWDLVRTPPSHCCT